MNEERFGALRFSPGDAFPLSTDSVLLADFARCPKGSAVCDLGCGSGAISLLLLSEQPDLLFTGVDCDPAAIAAAEENIRQNGLEAHFRLVPGDLREIRALLPAGSFTCAVSNPPYYPAGSGAVRAGLARATSEQGITPEELFAAADWLLQWGGRFFLVHRPERLTDLLCAGRLSRLEAKRLRLVRHHHGAPVSLILLEFRKGGGSGLQWEDDLILFDAQGQETAETRRIYHREV